MKKGDGPGACILAMILKGLGLYNDFYCTFKFFIYAILRTIKLSLLLALKGDSEE
jgi:hypothetical protein